MMNNIFHIDISDVTRYLYPVGIAVCSYGLLSWVGGYLSILRQVRGLPAVHAILGFFEPGHRNKMPSIAIVCPVNEYLRRPDFDKYDKPRSDLIAYTAATYSRAVYVTASPTTAQYISSKSSVFLKPLFMGRYSLLNKFGRNIITAQTGPDFKRYKAVIRGCFGETVMKNAWERTDEAVEIMLQGEEIKNGGMMNDVLAIMFKVTLLIIGSVGFGQDFPWHMEVKPDGELSFYESLNVVMASIPAQLMIPAWLMRLVPTAKFKLYHRAQHDFQAQLFRMYHAKRIELAATTHEADIKPPIDLLGALVSSQMNAEVAARLDKGKTDKVAGLTEKEIIGSSFILIAAGHETTGHTLTFTLAWLSLYPEWQRLVYQEIETVCGEEKPSYRDMNRLRLCLAVCLESLRLTEIIRAIFKVAEEDTTLPYTTWSADHKQVEQHVHFIKKGSIVVVDTAAAQSNPFHWTDAMTFNPRRHLRDHPDSSIPYTTFSLGLRQCIGKRFAEVEMASFIAHLLRHFTVHPVPVKDGETWEKMRERMLEHTIEELTLTPEKFDVRLEKRSVSI